MREVSVLNVVSVAAMLLVAPFTATAAWPTDPAVNLAIGDRTGEQVQPKVRATADGGCYISWFDNSAGGYDVYLQRLDPAGDEQWVHNGLLLADRSFSSTEDYGLDVDTAGNAVLAFRDENGPLAARHRKTIWHPSYLEVHWELARPSGSSAALAGGNSKRSSHSGSAPGCC